MQDEPCTAELQVAGVDAALAQTLGQETLNHAQEDPIIHERPVSDVACTRSLLLSQLNAIESLYRIYKVEQYSLLEEMRIEHDCMIANDHPVMKLTPNVLDSESSKAHPGNKASETIVMNQSIRSRVLGKRKITVSKCELDPASEVVTVTGNEGVPGSGQDKKSPAPNHSPTSPTKPTTAPPSQTIIPHSSPGVSLNMWMPTLSSAATNTPQSLRQPFKDGIKNDQATENVQGASSCSSIPQLQVPFGGLGGKSGVDESVYGDETVGYGSDDEPASYSDVEKDVLTCGQRSSGPELGKEPASWRARFADKIQEIAIFEGIASGCTQTDLDAEHSAIASLNGRAGRFLLFRPTVLIGRGSCTKGGVDVDLSGLNAGGTGAVSAPSVTKDDAYPEKTDVSEPATVSEPAKGALKVSRRQAFVSLMPDGSFCLENVGRRIVRVNGVDVAQFCKVPLRHLALVEMGGGSLLFMVNQLAVERVLRRSARIAV